MAISTNSVIHYTDKIDNLKGIIKCNGFKMKYCLEEINFNTDSTFDVAFPMCSFCDIPLSEVKNHIDSYGSYGIGLSKNWAKKSGLNPVLYIERNSKLADNLKKQALRIYKQGKNNKPDYMLLDEFMIYISHCKNYEGNLKKGKINSDSYRFYDEKEWRYVVPEKDLNGAHTFIDAERYLKDKDSYNDNIKDCYLRFSPQDISYIIIDSEDEIPEILKTINETFDDTVTSKELKILSTKIITKNQIWNDF